MRKESTRDHVDLSSQCWPTVYEVPSATTSPQVSNIHNNITIVINYIISSFLQTIHEKHLKSPHSLPTPSGVALEDHNYCHQVVHTLTQTTDRYIVGDRFHNGPGTSGHKKPTCKETCKFHNMRLCPEVTQYQSVVSEVINSKIKAVRLRSSSQ